MRCDQIRPYLPEYIAGSLPSYKASWVAQHLAGCGDCRTHEARLRRQDALKRAPVAAAAELKAPMRERRRRSWVGTALLLLLIAAVGTLVWLSWRGDLPRIRGAGWLPRVELPVSSAPQKSETLSFQARMQSRDGVSLVMESLRDGPNGLVVSLRFQGHDLLPPGDLTEWITAEDMEGNRLTVAMDPVTADFKGVLIQFTLRLPQDQDRFLIRVDSIYQVVPVRWSLALPDPPERLELAEQLLEGTPAGTRLMRYGKVGQLLQVELEPGPTDGPMVPQLYLQDSRGGLYAASAKWTAVGDKITRLQYPIPRTLHLPVTLVGEGYTRKHLGPWVIEATVVR